MTAVAHVIRCPLHGPGRPAHPGSVADPDLSRIGKFVGHSTAIFVVTLFALIVGSEHRVLPDSVEMVLGLGIPLAGFALWIALLVRLARAVDRKRSAALAVLAAMPACAVAGFVVVIASIVTGIMKISFGHGRPLRGRHRRPRVRIGVRRSAVPVPAIPWRTRMRLAAAWLDDARCEAESVAAFTVLATRLERAGVSAALVADARRFADEEHAHTIACLQLASRHAGVQLGLDAAIAPVPRAADLADLAAESLDDGCLGEGLSAVAAQRAAHDATDAETRAVLGRIAREEAAHAEHGWAIVEHCLAVGGGPVRDRITTQLVALARRHPIALVVRTPRSRILVDYGRAAESHRGATFVAVRETVLARARALLDAAR